MSWIGEGLDAVRAVLSFEAFEAEQSPACVLSTDGVILAVNTAWDDFATANGAPERITSRGIIGTRWIDHITGDIPRALALHALETARKGGYEETPSGAIYPLECNAPGLLRLVGACFMPIRAADGGVGAIAVVYGLEDERSVGERVAHDADDPGAFVHPDGWIRQCSGCRRFVDPIDGTYRYARDLVDVAPSPVSHGLCQVCIDLWWGVGSYAFAQNAKDPLDR